MQKLDDIKASYPLSIAKLVKTGKSAVIDTADTHSTLLIIARGSGTSTCKYYFYHASASTSSPAGTAFGTNPSLSTTGASAVYCVLIQNQPAMKRYLIIKQSTLAASLAVGVVALGSYNRAVPPSATLGAFTSVTRLAV